MPYLLYLLMLIAGYLIGALPFGFLIARWRDVDIFKQGSGNLGATNVGRVLGRRYGVLVFVLDFLKGAVPVAAALRLTAINVGGLASVGAQHWLPPLVGLAALLGHLFPVYLRFRGGKGVATGAGVMAVLVPGPVALAVLIWIVVVSTSRYVSLASMAAAGALLVCYLGQTPEPFSAAHAVLTGFCCLAVVLVFQRHRANIQRLWRGQENRLKDSARMFLATKVLHVLGLGLWFGSVVFFLVAASLIFQAFQSLADNAGSRPAWLPLPASFNPTQANQLAGIAVGPIFDWYFPLQVVCGIVALATAVSWWGAEGSSAVHRWRVILLGCALAMVLIGWPLARYVGRLRLERYSEVAEMAQAAQAAFGSWHLASLLLNFVTLILVGVALALAARLPEATAVYHNDSQAAVPQGSGLEPVRSAAG